MRLTTHRTPKHVIVTIHSGTRDQLLMLTVETPVEIERKKERKKEGKKERKKKTERNAQKETKGSPTKEYIIKIRLQKEEY